MTITQLKYAIAVANAKSMNEAAKTLFISQPSLSGSIRELELEIGVEIFGRTNRGIYLTPQGEEFIGYARQVVEQYRLMEVRYIEKSKIKKKFAVSMQHYTFAVHAFMEVVKQVGMDEYEFAIRETKTYEVIEDVKNYKSEMGIIYINEYMWKGNPLANKECVTLKELEAYPCLSFEQGSYNSFYFAEEVLSTYEYKQLIKVNDRATMLNLMVGLNGYTMCSGILCEELNGPEYCAVKLDVQEKMTIGYLKRKGGSLSLLGQKYVEEMQKFKNHITNAI